jgi:hypothetical protein
VLSVDVRTAGRDRAALARLIEDAEADAVCLHNAPHLGRWRQKAADLARRAGRVVVTAGGRRTGANLLLTTLGVDAVAAGEVRLPGGTTLTPPGAALAQLRVGGRPLLLGAATLIGNAADRLAQARQLQAEVARQVPGTAPAVLSAIGTDRPGTAAWQALADGRVAAGGRFYVDDPVTVVETRELGRFAVRPAVLAVLEV